MARPKRKKKDEDLFNQTVVNYFLEKGATDTGEPRYPLQLKTKAGVLGIQPYDSWIAMRFEDVDAAKEHLPYRSSYDRLNPYSGKYNVMFNDHEIPDTDFVKRTLDRALAPVLL